MLTGYNCPLSQFLIAVRQQSVVFTLLILSASSSIAAETDNNYRTNQERQPRSSIFAAFGVPSVCLRNAQKASDGHFLPYYPNV